MSHATKALPPSARLKRGMLAALIVVCLIPAFPAVGALVLYTNDVTFNVSSAAVHQADTVVISNATLTLDVHASYGTRIDYQFDNLILTNDAEIICKGQNVSPWDINARGTAIVVANDLSVYSNAQITANGQGFSGGTSGWGKGPGAGAAGRGGAYGGRGGRSNVDSTRAAPYGAAANAVHLGSGGGGGSLGNGGAGGGTIVLDVGGTLDVDGTITTRGVNAGASNTGAGSGGSISVDAGIFKGYGVLRTNGGASINNGYGAGSGGRIDLGEVVSFQFSGTLQANGGLASGSESRCRGFAGTICFPDSFDLVVSTAPEAGEIKTPLRLGSDGSYDHAFDTVDIESGATLELDSNPNMNPGFGGAATISADAMQVVGTLSANGLGWPGGGTSAAGDGPAAGGYSIGGSHGGRGGCSGSAPYGVATNAVYPGSGGGGGSQGVGGNGGGLLLLDIAGTLIVSGTISANGGTAIGNNAGGGSGGSVRILQVGTLTGSGLISANGGNAKNSGSYYGAGGGGRIDLGEVTDLQFNGELQVNGGTGAGITSKSRGYAGTIHFPTNYDLVVSAAPAAGQVMTPLRLGTDGTYEYAFNTVVIESGAVLEIDGEPTLNSGNGGAATLTAGALQVTGTLSANALGFGAGQSGSTTAIGPGAGTVARGGSYGGRGGKSGAAPYGTATNAMYLGSGGGGGSLGAGGNGGGALVLDVSGTVTVAGTISANGGNALGNNAAGRSGGSICIVQAGTLTGSGLISANGGDAKNAYYHYGSGGGGRIDLSAVTSLQFNGSLQANGGMISSSSNKSRGFAGTLHLPDAYDLVISAAPAAGQFATPLRLGSDGTYDYTFSTVDIESGATLEIDGNRAMNGGKGGVATISATSMLVAGTLSANGLGFGGGLPGSTGGEGTGGGTGSGAGYGGPGEGASPGGTYGLATNAAYFGSGAGGGSLGSGGGGGGVIMLDIIGALDVPGTISANGASAAGGNAGGGSGGSVHITAGVFSGSGLISANGGSAGAGRRGGAGRIAVFYRVNSFVDLPEPGVYEDQESISATVLARGAYNTGVDGTEDGSIYIEETAPNGMIIIFR